MIRLAVLIIASKGVINGAQVVHWWWRTRSRHQSPPNGFFRPPPSYPLREHP